MSGHRDDRNRIQSRLFRKRIAQRSDHGAWLYDREQYIRADAKPSQQRLIELARGLVHHTGSRGIRVFTHFPACQQIRQQVGHEEDAVGSLQRGILFPGLGVQLEDCVEIHDLDAGRAIEFFPRDDLEDLCGDAGRIRIAVSARQAQQRTVRCHAAEVNPPGVDADGIQPDTLSAQLPEASHQMLIKGIDVPVETSPDFKRLVGEAVDFLQGKGSIFKNSQYAAAGSGPEVESQECAFSCHCFADNLQIYAYLP